MPRLDVTLSFDNGPEPEATPRVLEVLDHFKIAATFFVVGDKLAQPERRAIAKQAAAAGHWIGNHTKTHSRPLGRVSDPRAVRAEILDTEKLIGELAHPERLFRPFGGGGELGTHLLSRAAVEVLTEQRMTCVLWNAIPRDWEDPHDWVDVAIAQCEARPWTLIVLHDLPTGAMDHLEAFIERVLDHGGRFRQDFPPECVPIRRGEVLAPLEAYLTA